MWPFGRKEEIRSFDEDVQELGPMGRCYRGVHPIPVEAISGSVGRAHELRSNFMPIVRPHGDWRFVGIRSIMEQGGTLPPIDVYKLGSRYYVVDGNHRVAAARYVGQIELDAVITEFWPATASAAVA